MNLEDYNKYYIQGSDHYLIPKDVFIELFEEMENWREEAKELKKQLEYLRSGEYYNQLRFERDMLQYVADNGKVSKEDKEFIDDAIGRELFNSVIREIASDFEDGSYGTFSKVPTFNITTTSGEQITITTDVQDTTVTDDGDLVIPVTFTAPNPTLLKEYSGTFELNTILHEIVPFAA